MDAWHALSGGRAGIAYWAHVGGFVAGFGLGIVYLRTRVATMAYYDNPNLLDYLTRKKQKGRPGTQRAKHRDSGSAPARKLDSTPQNKPAPAPAPVPAAQDVNLNCPHCTQNLDVLSAMIGRAYACPSCGGFIELEQGTVLRFQVM